LVIVRFLSEQYKYFCSLIYFIAVGWTVSLVKTTNRIAERQKVYLKEHPPQPKPKLAPVQRELHTVFIYE
jgi:hypothetical protein